MAKVLVITGGSRGIGEETVKHFMHQGYRIINLSRSQSAHAGVLNIHVDLVSSEKIHAIADQLIKSLSPSDQVCLVHNAAAFKADKTGEIDERDLHEMINVNLVAPVILNNLLIPHMPRGSSIIYIGSTLSEIAVANRASYVMSKHALLGMMRATCQDLAENGIHTCCLAPGFVNTEMALQGVDSEAFQHFIAAKVIGKRLIEANEIAELIYFCAQNPVINGSLIHANLGQVMS